MMTLRSLTILCFALLLLLPACSSARLELSLHTEVYCVCCGGMCVFGTGWMFCLVTMGVFVAVDDSGLET